ncbi:glycosyltransferase family 4 protein [Listeria grandensis]|uniref:Glycosyltransferase family 4 protein n=1 Tax=Listeria grandensis TaxID=1494963 RepID=A0A7X1CPI7_9LIST|nr:glycosyltransferase [Listeria grandensis]MBC1474450.1 glycosyltransferase family 4 protein [Listeria grandensis]MBC1935996.1 glycosyltransferase family 4 protein [Listeria grandensis]
MMFSSVHPYQDARIFYKEALTLAKYYYVDFYGVGNGQVEVKENLSISLLPKRSRLQRYKNILELKKQIKKSSAKFYHFHDPELLLLVPFIQRNKKGAKIIYDMHENFPAAIQNKNWIPKPFRKVLSLLVENGERHYLKMLNGLIFAEKSYSKHYVDIDVAKADIYNFPIRVDISQCSIPNIKTRPLRLIYIGRIATVRGVFEMLEAVSQLVREGIEVELLLIGESERNVLQEIISFIEANELQNHVCYKPYVNYEDIWEYYFEADVGICLLHPVPNYTDSLATKIFEYMAASLPMIVSDFPIWKQLMDENKCGIAVCPHNIGDIKKSVYTLLDDSLRLEMGSNGRDNYEKKYNWEIEGKKLADFYNTLG